MERLLYYIWHDCFVYRGREAVIVFDYYSGASQALFQSSGAFVDFLRQLAARQGNNLPIYVLVSHHHKDHFTRDIFGWAEIMQRVHYVISKDTERSVRYLFKPGGTYHGPLKVNHEQVTVLKEGERYDDGVVKVSAFGSTDTGNSYVVEVDGLTLFHAGDLNAWVWKDESTQAEIQSAINEFKSKLAPISKAFPRLDCAMFPVDKRIGRDCWEGAGMFVRTIDTGLFVPMHCCLYANDQERIDFIRSATRFGDYANAERGYYCAMTESGECLVL